MVLDLEQLPLPLDVLPFRYERGLQLSGSDLWLDPHSRRPVAYVSHGHSDHCLPHGHALATPATAEFYRLRTKRSGVTEVPFGRAHRAADQEIELFPAGHVLGASQVLATAPDGRRLVYTGDFKLRQAPCLDAAEVRECDVLVMECTFGHPRYRFPNIDEIDAQLRAFVDRCFEQDVIPVVMGYILGKSQEALCLLTRAGYAVAAHESIVRVCEVYERQGVEFGPYESLRLHRAPRIRRPCQAPRRLHRPRRRRLQQIPQKTRRRGVPPRSGSDQVAELIGQRGVSHGHLAGACVPFPHQRHMLEH